MNLSFHQINNVYMENTILSRLQKAKPDGCSSTECLERVCREVTYDIVSESCSNAEARKELKILCEHLHFPIRTQSRPLPAPASGNALPIKEGIGYVLCGFAYFVGYWLSESHWVGGIACVGVGLIYNQYVSRKVEKPVLAPSNENPVEILTTDAELAAEIERMAQTLTNIIRLLEKDTPVASEDLLENKYFRILDYLYNSYISCISKSSKDTFQMDSIEMIFDTYGYKLVLYSDEYAPFFRKSFVVHKSTQVTTKPALLNQKGECVFEGYVICPKVEE